MPHLAWCASFELRAACAFNRRLVDVVLASGDPIFPARPPRPFDSRLEQRFAADFAQVAPTWDVVREPAPVRAGAALIHPDFLLRSRLEPDRRVLLEIVGFWTPEYLATKLAHLRAARLPPFILCIDGRRGCADGELPAGSEVVRFERRIDAAAVLAVAERMTAQGRT